MMNESLHDKVSRNTKTFKSIGFPDSGVALRFVQHTGDFESVEIVDVYKSLSKSIKKEIKIILDDYLETKEMYIISSTGKTLDISNLLKRLSKIIDVENM